MSKIVVKVDNITNRNDVISCIRRITGLGMSDIQRKIQSGETIGEYVLFYNDHDEVASTLRALISEVKKTGSTVSLYEISENEDFAALPDIADYEVSEEVVNNIIDQYEQDRDTPYEDDGV